MQQMGLTMALAVAWEAFGVLIPVLAVLVLLDLAVLVLAARRRAGGWRPSLRIGAVLGLVAFVAAISVLPGITDAGFADLSGLLDYGILLGIGVAVGIGVWLMALGPLHLLFGRRRPS